MNAPDTLTIPVIPGTLFAGGHYAGRFFIGGQAFALVVAPKAEGEHEPAVWHEDYRKNVEGAQHYADGQANTMAMLEAGCPLARWALELRIGEHDDWYLPSRLEALILFAELRDRLAGTADAFEEEWYWTSTQLGAGDESYAWVQSVGNGYQGHDHKVNFTRARAVRRVAI